MNRLHPLLAGAALLAFAAFAQSPDTTKTDRAARKDLTEIKLHAVDHSSSSGRATIVAVKGSTSVAIEIGRLPDNITVPIHLKAFIYAGSCANKGATPQFSLTRNELADSESGPGQIGAATGPVRLSGTAPVSLATLRASPFSVSVSSTAADGNKELLCGDYAG